FGGYDEVKLIRYRLAFVVGVFDAAVAKVNGAAEAGTVGVFPGRAWFVDGGIGALRLAGAAVDAIVRDMNGHCGRGVVRVIVCRMETIGACKRFAEPSGGVSVRL